MVLRAATYKNSKKKVVELTCISKHKPEPTQEIRNVSVLAECNAGDAEVTAPDDAVHVALTDGLRTAIDDCDELYRYLAQKLADARSTAAVHAIDKRDNRDKTDTPDSINHLTSGSKSRNR